MIRKHYRQLLTILLLVGLGGCEARTDKGDTGGVLLTISDFDGLPISVSVNGAAPPLGPGFVQIGQLTVNNIPKDPTGVTSALMDVEIQSLEVTYTRADSGTRVPPPYTAAIFGNAPVGGTFVLDNMPFMGNHQLLNTPLSDLLLQNFGFDSETRGDTITLNVRLRFFGRTLSGDAVESQVASFTLEFTA